MSFQKISFFRKISFVLILSSLYFSCGVPEEKRACRNSNDCQVTPTTPNCLQGFCSEKECMNGAKEECYKGISTTRNIGKCSSGSRICLQSGSWSECLGQKLPSNEICDREDNDCDGKIDEELDCTCKPGDAQKCYSGSLETSNVKPCKYGKQFCQLDRVWGRCLEQKLPLPEKCDNIDNDCDGKVDENLSCACKIGESKVCYDDDPQTLPSSLRTKAPCKTGTRHCDTQSKWGKCVAQVLPKKEVCDGVDNNCNGLTDETFPEKGKDCTVKQVKGPCKRGQYYCQSGSLTCITTFNIKKTEICGNKIDDNCNGQIDESPPCIGCKPGTQKDCYVGSSGCSREKGKKFICKGQCSAGRQFCLETRQWGECLGSILPAEEKCDGEDNDCNGKIDDSSPQNSSSCETGQKGSCSKGKRVCQEGETQCVQVSYAKTEVCDNIDNDCDGEVDEGNPGGGGFCGTGKKGDCSKGKQVCQGGRLVCTQLQAPTIEKCDNIDNDCDGRVDEENSKGGTACSTGLKGLCVKGKLICQSGKLKCTQQIKSSTEICDNKDNDCDGQTDEDNPGGGSTCSTGKKGICKAGIKTCIFGSLRCEQKQTPSLEVCDGKDNDCNGQIDEKIQRACYTGTKDTQRKGICHSGIQNCKLGSWESCKKEQKPEKEVCDGKDNNCDGQTDEGCSCQNGKTQSCGIDTGECKKGSQTCNMSGKWSACNNEIKSTSETCDGKDNDCDGIIDEGKLGGGESCNTSLKGSCKAGFQICILGKIQCKQLQKPTGEICNGKDNDCNGKVDDNSINVGKNCNTSLQGICNKGKTICVNGKIKCKQLWQPSDETCDGKDNNCDGVIDEGNPNSGASCKTNKLGPCVQGMKQCESGSLKCISAHQVTQELCDGIDNDCNGQIDENATRNCTNRCGSGKQSCDNGVFSANCVIASHPETCNRKDDDCDGLIDEGCQCGRCSTDKDCDFGGAGGICSQGNCYKKCSSNSDCKSPFKCQTVGRILKGYCAPPITKQYYLWSCLNYLKMFRSCYFSISCGGYDSKLKVGARCFDKRCTTYCRSSSDCDSGYPHCKNSLCKKKKGS